MTDALPQTLPPRPRVLPPGIVLIGVGAMWLLDRYAPIAEATIPLLPRLGITLIALGAALVLWCAWEFRRAGTPVMPFLEPTALIARGPYRVSRNPIYLGYTLTLTGVAALLGSSSPFVVLPLFVWFIQRRFVDPEERLLEQRFGEVYRAYKGTVRRWI